MSQTEPQIGVSAYRIDLGVVHPDQQSSLKRLRGTTGRDVLYSNSTLVIDPSTGDLVWYYQHLPCGNRNLDHVFERYLVDVAAVPDPAEEPWISPRIMPASPLIAPRAGPRLGRATGLRCRPMSLPVQPAASL